MCMTVMPKAEAFMRRMIRMGGGPGVATISPAVIGRTKGKGSDECVPRVARG